MSSKTKALNEKLSHIAAAQPVKVPENATLADAVIQYLAENFPAAVVNRPPEPHLKAAETDGA